MKNPMMPMKCSAMKSIRNTIGVGSLSDCPTIRGLRKYHSNAWMIKSIVIMVTMILQPGYSTIPAKRIGIPPIKTQRIGTKLERNVIHPSARI
jgi:hypothetical protein